MFKSLVLSILLVFIFSNIALATAQAPDILVYQGQKYSLYANPLDMYYETNPEQKRPDFSVTNTSLWRGYIANWEVKNDKLYLVGIRAEIKDKKAEIKDLFPKNLTNEVFADWYTGYLIVPLGEVDEYVHMGYASSYKKYLIFKLISGELKQCFECNKADYDIIKKKQFAKYKETADYQKMVAEEKKNRGEKYNQSQLDQFLFEYLDLSTIIVD